MSEQNDLARIAAMEQELAALRKFKSDLAHNLTTNPAGALEQLGVPRQHVTQVLVGTELGDQAPPQLRAAAAMGPLAADQRRLAEENQTLAKRLADLEARAARETAKATAADETKYPHLSKALKSDPSFMDDFGGVSADQLEARLAKVAKALGVTPAASKEAAKADGAGADGAGIGSKPQAISHNGGNPPPTATPTRKGWTDEDRDALRDEIVRKAERGEYDAPGHPYRPA